MAIENLIPWRRNTSMSSSPFSSNLGDSSQRSISSLQREMNRMFNNIWSSPSLGQSSLWGEESPGFFQPDIEMTDTNGHIEVTAELPGVTRKDIEVTVSADGNTLSIRGEKKLEREKKAKDCYYAERSYGTFRRTLGLPSPVDPDQVNARFTNGVLEVRLTKVADASSGMRHIKVEDS